MKWFTSYLYNRLHMFVWVRIGVVSVGVPQGSILGPLLFILYITYDSCWLHLSINIYADDMELHASAYRGNLETLSDVIQQDLDRIGEWLSSNRLSMNS